MKSFYHRYYTSKRISNIPLHNERQTDDTIVGYHTYILKCRRAFGCLLPFCCFERTVLFQEPIYAKESFTKSDIKKIEKKVI